MPPDTMAFSVRTQRHARWVERFSDDVDLHDRLFQVSLDRTGAVQLVARLAHALDLPTPDIRFHGSRKRNTGQCVPSRSQVLVTFGEEWTLEAERRRGRRFPERAVVRLGATTLAAVVAHEIGHHFVHEIDGMRTPGHGKVWVARYDAAAIASEATLAL